jgi:hypothetical protein
VQGRAPKPRSKRRGGSHHWHDESSELHQSVSTHQKLVSTICSTMKVGLSEGSRVIRSPRLWSRANGKSTQYYRSMVIDAVVEPNPGQGRNQTSKTSNPATAKPAASNAQSPKSKPSKRPSVVIRTLTEPSDIVRLLGPDAVRSDSLPLFSRSRPPVRFNLSREMPIALAVPLPTR